MARQLLTTRKNILGRKSTIQNRTETTSTPTTIQYQPTTTNNIQKDPTKELISTGSNAGKR